MQTNSKATGKICTH